MKCLICGDPSNGRWIIATLWHFRLIDFDQFAFVRGTFKTFGFRSTLTLISPSEERKRAIMDRNDLRQRLLSDIESKDRAYADLSHLCANYKAEIERLAFHKADVDATNEQLRQEVIPLQKRLALKDDKLDKARARIRQLEALVREALTTARKAHWPGWYARAGEALAVPQEGNK